MFMHVERIGINKYNGIDKRIERYPVVKRTTIKSESSDKKEGWTNIDGSFFIRR